MAYTRRPRLDLYGPESFPVVEDVEPVEDRPRRRRGEVDDEGLGLCGVAGCNYVEPGRGDSLVYLHPSSYCAAHCARLAWASGPCEYCGPWVDALTGDDVDLEDDDD